jgi:hypothetical protein
VNYSSFIWSNGGTLDSYFVLLDGLCGIQSDLVISGVSVLHRQIEILIYHYLLQSSSPGKAGSGVILSSPKLCAPSRLRSFLPLGYSLLFFTSNYLQDISIKLSNSHFIIYYLCPNYKQENKVSLNSLKN